jgi:DNA-binding NarL/FixJ family response regulator
MSANPCHPSTTVNRRPKTLTCVVVEDQGLFLEMLGGMLNMRGGLVVTATALNVAEGRAACTRHRPDLLLLDLDLPDGSGLDVARHLLDFKPSARIIIVSGHADEFVSPRWLHDSIHAVISKNDTFSALRGALDELLALHNNTARPRDTKSYQDKPLTAREAEIFALIGQGLSSKEIGGRLYLSEHTVQAHRKRIATKLGTTGAELMQRAISQRSVFFSAPEATE